MAKNHSFDISTGMDLQEVDNAVNQARKEVAQRYDFKGTSCVLEFDRDAGEVRLDADDEYRLKALYEVLVSKLSRRGVPLKNLDPTEPETGSLGRARQVVHLKQGIPKDTARDIVKAVKDLKLKKIQVQIQEDEVRVTGPERDALQEVIAALKGRDFGVELSFGNYR